MSENTRLDIDSNIPQQMDKIGKAADFAAKRMQALARNPVSALEELRKALTNLNTGASDALTSTEEMFNRMVAVVRTSSAPAELKKMYDTIEKDAAKHHRQMLGMYERVAGYENDILEAQAAIDKARRQKKNASTYRMAKNNAEIQLKALKELIAEEDKLNESQIRKAERLYSKINEVVRTSSPSGPFLGTGENAASSLDLTRKAVEGHYNSLGVFISEKSEELRKITEKAHARALLLDTGEVRKYTAQAQRALAGHYDSLGNFVSTSAAEATKKIQDQAKAQARALLLDTGEIRQYTAQAQRALAGHYDSLGNFVQSNELKRYTLDANTYRSIKAQVEAATKSASGLYSDIGSKQLSIPDTLAPGLAKTGYALPGLAKGFRKLGDDMGYAHSFARGLASGFNLLWLTWGKLAPLFAGASISYGVAKTFQFGSEIEYNIRFLETLGDLTRTQGKVIREELRKMDESTMFSMSELSKTMILLAQAGYEARDSLTLTKVSADLATVGMTDMETSAKLLTQAMTLFKKPTEEAEKVSSQLYMATKSGKLDIKDLGESFKYASVSGLGYNQTLEGVLTGLATLADAGIKGSQAGTSYVNMLQDLTGRTKPAAEALKLLKISAYDSNGRMRDAATVLFEIGEAIKTIKPSEQMKVINKIFTERGIREYFAAIGKGSKQMEALKKSIEEVPASKVLQDAKNLQDTVKAGFEIMKSTLTSSLDKVFEANSEKFRAFFTSMTELLGSKEFMNAVNLMVDSFSALYDTLKKVGPALSVAVGGFLAFKAVTMAQSAVTGLTTAMGSMLPLIAQTRGNVLELAASSGRATVAFGAQGLSMLQAGVAARGAATGIEASAVASSLAATSAAKATVTMRGLAIVMGFLANPIVGLITTLGIMAATWWSVSRDSMDASQQLSDKVVENGKVNVKALDEEIKKLLERNSIASQNNPIAENALSARLEAEKAFAAIAKTQQELLTAPTELIAKGLRSRLAAERKAYLVAAENAKALAEGAEKYRKGQEEQEAKDAAERQKRFEANTKGIVGTLDPNDINGAGAANRAFDRYASSMSRMQSALKQATASVKKFGEAELAQLDATAKRRMELLDAEYNGGLLAEGEYQGHRITLLQTSEAEKLKTLQETRTKLQDSYAAELSTQAHIGQLALADFKGTQAAKLEMQTSYEEKIKSLVDAFLADLESNEAKQLEVKEAALLRYELTFISHRAKLKKLEDENKKYFADLELERNKEAALAKLNKQYENVNDSSVIWLQAEKAGAMASAEAFAKHEGKLRDMEKAYEDVAKAEADMLEAVRRNEEAGIMAPGVPEALARTTELKLASEKQIAEYRRRLDKDIAEQGAIAYQEAYRKRANEFKNTVAQTLADALISGANDGGKSLRKILENELKAPFVLLFRMSIDALLGDLGNAVSSAAGGGTGSGGASSVLSTLSTASTLNTAYKALSGAIEGSIGKSFEKFALSDIGSSLGLSSSNGVVPVFEYSASGELSAVGDSLTANTKAVTDFGKTFTDVGTSMAAAFAGQALRKGISGGYSVGGAGETVMDIAALIAGFDPSGIASIITGAVSGLINRTFGRKLKDTGIQGTFAANEFKGESYQFYKGGWLRSDKTKTSALDQETTNTFTNTFRSIQASTAVLATNMGLSAKAALDFQKEIKISLKDLDPAAQNEAITKMFTDMQEEMATAVLDAWGDWSLIAKYGETASEVLTNVSNNLTGFNGMLDTLDLRLIELTMNGAAAASAVIEAAGGIEQLTGIYGSYYENFYSEAERNSKSIETLGEKFTSLGVTMPALVKDANGFVTNGQQARDTFRELVAAAANTGNIALATELVKLSDEFASVTPIVAKTREVLDSLKQSTKELEAQFLKAQGNLDGYAAAMRAIETVDMTAVELATYDYNKTLEKYIELLGQAEEARATATEAEIRLLQAQGNETAALSKQRELDIKGLSEAQVAAYDYAAAIDRQISAMEKLSAAQDEIAAADIKLMQAQGNETAALAKQRELDIRNMSRAEVAAYDYAKSVDAQISKLEQAADIVSKLGDASSDLASYLKGFEADSTNSFYKTIGEALSGDLDAMGRVTSEADKAIESARSSARSTSEFALKRAEVIAKVGQVKAFSDTLSKETDAEKIIKAIKGSTTTSDEVKSLGTRLSSEDIAVSLNATLESIKKTAGANTDIAGIQNLFTKLIATVSSMSMAKQATDSGQAILKMFDSMRATVLTVTMSAPKSEVDKVTSAFSSITAFVNKIAASGLNEASAQTAVGSAANITAAINKLVSYGLTTTSAQTALASLANITSYIAAIDVKPGNTLSKQFESELAAYSSISANISAITVAANIVEDKKLAIKDILSTIAANINAISTSSGVAESRKAALNDTFSSVAAVISSINTASGIESKFVEALTDSLASFQAKVSAIAVTAPDSNLKDLLLGNSDEISYGLALAAAIEACAGNFGLSEAQAKSVLLGADTIKKTLSVAAGVDGPLTAAQTEAYTNTRTEITKALAVEAGTDGTLTEAQKTVLANASTSLTKALAVKAGTDGTLTEAQKTVLANASTSLTKLLSVASGKDAVLTAAQQSVLSGVSASVVKTLAVKAGTDGTLTTAQQQAYANASSTISKAVSVVKGTDATNLTEAQKVLLGILGGSSDGKVTVGGSVDYKPSSELDDLMGGLADALGRVGIEKMTTELGRLTAAINRQLAATDAEKKLADAQRVGADIAARIADTSTQIKSDLDTIASLGAKYGYNVNRKLGDNPWQYVFDIVSQPDFTSLSYGGAVTADPSKANTTAFAKALLAANVGNSTVVKQTELEAAILELEAARNAVRALGGIPQFSVGGYTGPGGVNDVAGIVHAGEIVWSQSDIANAGGVDVVEAMRKGFMPYPEDIPAPGVTYNTTQSTINFDESALLEELQAMREELSNMRYEVRATAINTGKAAKHLKEFDDRGMKVKNSDTGALETTTV